MCRRQRSSAEPPALWRFYDKDGYNGRPPGRAVLRAAWSAVWDQRGEYDRRSAQLADGQILSVDETHKVMKGVRVNDCKVFTGLFTDMNEYNQVVAQVRVYLSAPFDRLGELPLQYFHIVMCAKPLYG